jgi:hypothetical protein
MISEIIAGLMNHGDFIFFNTISHLIAGIVIATAIFPFLSEKLKNRYNYFIVVFFPAVFSSVFPDLMFISSTIVKHRSLTGLFDALSHGGDVYSAFHFGLPLILVVPTVVFILILINKVFKKSFDRFPKWCIALVTLISLFCAGFHIIMDGVGF